MKRQQLGVGQRRVADAAGRAMAFMLVAVAVGGIGAAADGPCRACLVGRGHVVMRLCVGREACMRVVRSLCHGGHFVQALRLHQRMSHVMGLVGVLLHGHGIACQAAQGQQQNQEQGEKATHGVNDSEGRV